jgi:hypothetical protein
MESGVSAPKSYIEPLATNHNFHPPLAHFSETFAKDIRNPDHYLAVPDLVAVWRDVIRSGGGSSGKKKI